MAVPQVAIVGRPNVGKSSLFNWLAGRRIAIVDPTAGVTRDRVSALVKVGDRPFELIDTGGMGIEDADDLTDDDRAADRDRHRPGRRDPVRRRRPRRLTCRSTRRSPRGCATSTSRSSWWPTSATRRSSEPYVADFYQLGLGEPVTAVSAQQNRGKAELLQLHSRPSAVDVAEEKAPEEPC